MRNNRLSALLGAALLSCAIGTAAELPPLSHGLTALDGQIPAPPLVLPDLDDEIVDLSTLRGKVVLINFWATWCPPCRREMPSMERLRQKVDPNKIVILAVNIGEDEDTVFSFLGTIEPQPEFPMLFDRDSSTLAAWQVRGLPSTYVVAPDGKLAFRAIGGREFDHPELVKQLQQLAATGPDAPR